MRVDPREQFMGVERFGDVIHRTQLETLDDVGGVSLRREKDDRDLAPLLGGLELAAGFKAVHLRHHHVQQDQVGLDAGQHFERLLAVRGDADLVALLFQNGRQRLDVGRRVVHH